VFLYLGSEPWQAFLLPGRCMATENVVVLGTVETPIGAFGAVVSPQGLGCLTFPTDPLAECEAWIRRWMPEARVSDDPKRVAPLAEQLAAYFEGGLREFTVPLDLRGSPFQVRVWRAVHRIPYGEVRSYAAVAAAIGSPRAVRAVGAANGTNPVPIVVPCHRVVGSNGALTGYGGGLDLKGQLLHLESAGSGGPPARFGR
jgi:O-6-methylguanine DNA methyltransferase